MKYLIIGGTGLVGQHVARQLRDKNADLTILSRNPESKKVLSGVKTIKGDLQSPKVIRRIFNGIDAVFMANTVSPTECQEGLMAINGAMEANVDRFVYLSVHHVDEAPYIPHFGSKLGIEEALKSSQMSYAIIRANNFYQNDEWYRDGLMQKNTYTQPIGSIGLSRVDVRDVAEASAILLTWEASFKRIISLVGPEVLSGERTAQIWSRVFGRMISYVQEPMAKWEQKARKMIPDWMAYDFRVMYEFFQEEGLKATHKEIKELERLLGHSPRSYHDYVKEAAKQWTKMAASAS